MKKRDIVVGGVYSNGKGRVRKVLDAGSQYVLYEGQGDQDNLLYEVIDDGTKRNVTGGEQRNMTRTAFASWAKERIR